MENFLKVIMVNFGGSLHDFGSIVFNKAVEMVDALFAALNIDRII
jgi:metal-dependent HD superfamily phosphatase/phosphodiesterase